VGVYRFWRDFGFVLGALLVGLVADATGSGTAIALVAVLTAASGAWVAVTRWAERDRTAERLATRRNVDELLAAARRRIEPRLTPAQAFEAVRKGALIVDLRSNDDRRERGVVPGSIHIPRSVLEWRVDPDCEFHNPAACNLEREVILMCSDGFSSSFATLSLRELGFHRSTDLIGGFSAWRAVGLPVRPAPEREAATELPGMGAQEPLGEEGWEEVSPTAAD
jgi:rhodanese-related sulfurtransferase